jgi:hypothetical protein
VHGLAPALVRDAEDGHLVHAGMPREHRLDLDGVHVLAAGDDHVLGAVDHEEVAVLVLTGEVAGAVPAVHQGGRGRVRPVPVAEHHVRPADPELADLPDRRAHLGLHTRDGHAHRRRPRVVVGAGQPCDGRRGLGHAVELDDVAVGEPLEHAPLQVG